VPPGGKAKWTFIIEPLDECVRRVDVPRGDDKGNENISRRVHFTIQTESGGRKIFDAPLVTAKDIKKLIQKGITRIEIERMGSGLQTRYSVGPA
jgi:hypothetical protein